MNKLTKLGNLSTDLLQKLKAKLPTINCTIGELGLLDNYVERLGNNSNEITRPILQVEIVKKQKNNTVKSEPINIRRERELRKLIKKNPDLANKTRDDLFEFLVKSDRVLFAQAYDWLIHNAKSILGKKKPGRSSKKI